MITFQRRRACAIKGARVALGFQPCLFLQPQQANVCNCYKLSANSCYYTYMYVSRDIHVQGRMVRDFEPLFACNPQPQLVVYVSMRINTSNERPCGCVGPQVCNVFY